MGSHSPDTQNHVDKIQGLGLDLVNDMHVYIRSLHLYSHDNKVFLRPLNRMEKTINWLIAREGKMHLYGASSTLYLNDQMLRFRVATLANVNFLLEELTKREIAGLLIDKPINQRQLQSFLKCFAEESEALPSSNKSGIQTESLDLVSSRLKEVSRAEIDNISTVKADSKRYAYLLYHRLYNYVSKLCDPDQTTRPPLSQAIRALQEFIDLLLRDDLAFLGFTEELDQQKYELYHICNVTLMSVMFGRHLELEKLKLLDLGLAALSFNLGKLSLDRTMLSQKKALSQEDYLQVKKVPLLSAKEILRGHFSWDRLRHAVIAANVNQPVQMGLQPGGSTKLKGAPLFSRILRLCHVFDALCTRRPFRPKLEPAEALMFMQKRMADEFDPFLLSKFVRMFGKMAVRATKKEVSPFNVADDRREVPFEGDAFLMGDALQNELEAYWSLRRMTHRTPEQEEELAFLARFLDSSKMGTMEDMLEDGVKTVTYEKIAALNSR